MGQISKEMIGDVKVEKPMPRILVVDDEPLIGTTLRVLLSDQHEVVVENSASSAMARLEEDDKFDAIVCDLMMPRVSGMDLHKWLKANRPELAKRIIFMTGGAFTEDADRFLEHTDVTAIEKPFDAQELIALVEKLNRGQN